MPGHRCLYWPIAIAVKSTQGQMWQKVRFSGAKSASNVKNECNRNIRHKLEWQNCKIVNSYKFRKDLSLHAQLLGDPLGLVCISAMADWWWHPPLSSLIIIKGVLAVNPNFWLMVRNWKLCILGFRINCTQGQMWRERARLSGEKDRWSNNPCKPVQTKIHQRSSK